VVNSRELQLTCELNFVYRRNSKLSHAAEAFLDAARSLSSQAAKK